MQTIVFIIAFAIIAAFLYISIRKKVKLSPPDPQIQKQILLQHVLFYQNLPADEKVRFEIALQNFLQKVRITGIKITVEDIDRVFIAAAAIIPIFAFAGWEYRNIHEVLLYPGSFNENYQVEGRERNLLGMVGNGPLQNVMILSQQDLRSGFLNHAHTSNTAIHEFVHLIDKADGDTDGFPGALLPHKYAVPWLKRMHEEIQGIRLGESDINPYGATSEAEFLAVAAEYFFQKPQLMEQNHPALFELLKQIFTPVKEN